MTEFELETSLLARGCTILEHAGDFVLVYKFGFEGRKRSHELVAKDRVSALKETWSWLHPEQRMAEQIEIIQRLASEEFCVSMHALCGGSRAEPMATARRVAMAIAATITPASTYVIGASFGFREHGTVLYAKTSVANQCETDLSFAARVGALRTQALAAFEKAKL